MADLRDWLGSVTLFVVSTTHAAVPPHDSTRHDTWQELVRLGRESDLYSRFVQWFYAHGQGAFLPLPLPLPFSLIRVHIWMDALHAALPFLVS